jgi:DNA-binding PadR family transcriptional regulator
MTHERGDSERDGKDGPRRGGGRRGGGVPRGGRGRGPGPGHGAAGMSGVRGEPQRRGRSRMRRGDVRAALMVALLDGPAHGYELIQRLETRTDGRWKPSPGSVYPLLQMMADEGLVTTREEEGKRVHDLTDDGRRVAEERAESGDLPWEAVRTAGDGSLRTATRDLQRAAREVALAGSPDAVARATEIVTDARRKLYGLLAES